MDKTISQWEILNVKLILDAWHKPGILHETKIGSAMTKMQLQTKQCQNPQYSYPWLGVLKKSPEKKSDIRAIKRSFLKGGKNGKFWKFWKEFRSKTKW